MNEMDEILKLIGDYGIVFIILAGLVLLFAKYIPTLMNIWIERLKTRNANNDLVLEVVRNNTNALKNNTVALESVRKHDEKTNQALDKINNSVCEQSKEIKAMSKDIAIIKERK